MRPNLFPAILLAGAPNTGKSVLAYLLTQHLRQSGISHYLLRAAPDGEGDWFYRGTAETVRRLRLSHKFPYNPRFIQQCQAAIENRWLPLLVDVGGAPQGEQISILRACSHAILLHRNDEEHTHWLKLLAELGLPLIADLRSSLSESERIEQVHPILQGVISGLERDETRRKTGMVFGALLDRVAGICRYDPAYLTNEHLRHAPLPPLTVEQLASRCELKQPSQWQPGDVQRALVCTPPGEALAWYGRSPAWLTAALAIHSLPAAFAVFDLRYGWVITPPLTTRRRPTIEIEPRLDKDGVTWWLLSLPEGLLEPDAVYLPRRENRGPLVLSGRLPLWAFAALARHLAPRTPWLAIDDPGLGQAIIVSGGSSPSTPRPGDSLSRAILPA